MCDEDLVKVAVRVRPLLSNETSKGARDIVKHPRDEQVSIENTAARSDNDRTKTFSYDHVFKETSTQQDVYDEAASKMVKNIFEGFNVTIIAYGQTGSGKTYTMGTTPKDKGIIHRFVTDTFTGLEKLAGSEEEKMTFEAEVRLLEIHNEILTDLLHDDEKRKSTISIREDAGGKNVISGLVREPVRSADDVVTCLRRGTSLPFSLSITHTHTQTHMHTGGELRATASTAMNDQSSRSHMVLFLDLVMKRPLTSNNEVEVDTLIPCDEIRSRITFVDLAGSERLKKTGATGKTRKEGIDINRGLLALGNVINALGDDRRRAGHVNYRDSKLTRILQDSLGGKYTLVRDVSSLSN
jgi:kinesin family member 4